MKVKNLLLAAACASVLSASAQGQSAIIEITGATAFRAGTLDLLRQAFVDSGDPFEIRWAGSGQFNASTRAIFRGNFKADNGTELVDVMIRTSFTGSTEGLRALDVADYGSPTANPLDATYLPTSVIAATPTVTVQQSGASATPVAADSDFAFTDADVASVAPIDGSDFVGAALGIVTFTMITNDGQNATAPVAPQFGGLTNVTSQQFRTLFANGRLPLSFFTGVTADNDDIVYATGRNDGSGTRIIYLAETGFGQENGVQQFYADTIDTTVSGGVGTTGLGIITRLRQAPVSANVTATDLKGPAADTTFPLNGAVSLYGNDTNGNGGYVSGSNLSTSLLPFSSKSTQVVTADGVSEIAAAAPVALITSIATFDSISAITAGARPLAYNGVGITPAAPLSAADKAKVTSGQYTLWSTEQIYGKDLDATEQLVFDTIVADIGPVILDNGTGIPLSDMQVARTGLDGSAVGPL